MKKINKSRIFISLLLIMCGIFVLQSCIPKSEYKSTVGKIVKIGDEIGPDDSKFRTPTKFHNLLIMNTSDTTLFLEFQVTPAEYYNCKIGDSVDLDTRYQSDAYEYCALTVTRYYNKRTKYEQKGWSTRNWFTITRQ